MSRDERGPSVGNLPQEDILTALAGATDDIIWLFTADWGEVVFVNDAYEEILDRPVGELEEDPTAFLADVHPDDREDIEELMAAVSAGESRQREIRFTPNDEVRWLQIQGRPIRTDGEVTHVAGFSRDVTARKRRERELEETKARLERSNEELQHFAYVASHDLQEPLRMVRSYMNLLESEYRDELDEEAREFIDFAVDGAERMKALIDGLLEFSRVETHGEAFEPCDCETVVADTRDALELRLEETDAELTVGDLPTVHADESQLRQVFQNLLSNAIDYAGDEPPRIEVRTERRGDEEVVLAVEDEGIGIPESERDDIFDIFERGSNASGDGAGIGLAISERIVERHGGEMWLESTECEGTTVYFSLAREPER